MKLFDNPIFITQKRLVHRAGVLAVVLIAALIGFSLLAGLIDFLADPNHSSYQSPQETGRVFYGFVVGVEIVLLVVAGSSRISRMVAEERKSGLWDSNCLTPLKPGQIVTGYWLGPALREFYMTAIMAGFGLLIVLCARLPITLWLGTQILIASTALFIGLFGLLMGMVFQRQQGITILLAIVFVPFSFIAPSGMLTNFLLPIYGIANLFYSPDFGNNNSDLDWTAQARIFGLPVPPVLLSIGLQFIVGVFLWRAAVRKTANPFQPLLLRWEAVVLFAILVVTQHGLLWGMWHGQFPAAYQFGNRFQERDSLLPIVQGGTIMIGAAMLAFLSPPPERVRVQSLRLGFKNIGAIFSRSAVSLALALTAVAAAALFTQCAFSMDAAWKPFAVATGNLLDFFLIFPLLFEFCRLRFKRRALGFVALWLFALCILPYILAVVFTSEQLARLSLLSPGVFALGDPGSDAMNFMLGIVLVHFGIAAAFFLAWWNQWKQLLEKTS